MADAAGPQARWRRPAPRWVDRAEPELSMMIALGGAVAALVVALVVPAPGWWRVVALATAVLVAVGVAGVAYMRLSRRRLSVIQVPRPATRLLLTLFRRVAPEVMAAALLMRDGEEGRDRLVSMYTRAHLDWTGVAAAATAAPDARTDAQRRALGALGALALSQLARAAYLHGDRDADARVAEALYVELEARGTGGPVGRPLTGAALLRRAKAFFFRGALLPEERLHLAELQHLRGDVEAARATIARGGGPDGPQRRLLSDLDNPFAHGGDADRWLRHLNAAYDRGGFAPVAVADGEADAFDRVTSDGGRRVSGGARVTVVVSSYSPDEALVTAVSSALASTWTDLEVLVVDDCSPPGSEDVYARVAGLDERVRVERLRANGGTYGCRNYALDHATGELITFQDSDDWLHPERIERQATHLLANAAVPANTTASVRTTPELLFTHDRTPAAKVCEPSLMFRREQVRDRVGYFDPVRKGADVEYRFRIAASFGVPVPALGSAPLTLQRVDADSLSGSEISRDWIHPKRRVYRRCFQRWHESTPPGELRVAADGERALFAPRGLLGGATRVDVDLVIAVPFATLHGDRGLVRDVRHSVAAAVADGRSVALWPIELPGDSRRSAQDLAAPWADLLNAGGVDVVCAPDEVDCRVLAVAAEVKVGADVAGATVRSRVATLARGVDGVLPRGASADEVRVARSMRDVHTLI